MTIQSVPYQAFSGMEYAVSDSYSRNSHAYNVSVPEAAAEPRVDISRAIDILLGQLEQISYQLARSEAQIEPVAAETEAAANVEEFAIGTGAESMDAEAQFSALVEQYAQLRAYVEETGAPESLFAPAGPFAGMLFGIAA